MKHFFTTLAVMASLSTPAPARAETVRFYHHDANGNLRLKTDATGAVVWESEPSPFGAYTTHTPGSPQRFLDQPQEDNGLVELGARFYDPNIGRFISADPAPLTAHDSTNPQSFNRFAYAVNNPYRYSDETGTIPAETVLDVIDIGWSAIDLYRDPSWGNAGFLAWSVGATLLPYVPGAWVTKGPRVVGVVRGTWTKFADFLPSVTVWALEHVDDAAKVARGGAAATKASSRALGQALEAAGHVRPAGSAAHHIFAGGAKAAGPARAALQRFGIGINDAANGVFLAASCAAPNAAGGAVHSTLHTRAYYKRSTMRWARRQRGPRHWMC